MVNAPRPPHAAKLGPRPAAQAALVNGHLPHAAKLGPQRVAQPAMPRPLPPHAATLDRARAAQPAMGPPAPAIGPARGGSIQPYRVRRGTSIVPNRPASLPWFGYPYVVATAGDFLAQERAMGVTGVHEFLTANGAATANITAYGGMRLAVRVSSGGDMAIEDTDLAARQPKVFYATQAVVTASNQALATGGSRIRLAPVVGHDIVILTGWYSSKTLLRVEPALQGGLIDSMSQNCNAVGAAVMGVDAERLASQGIYRAVETVKRIATVGARNYKLAYDDMEVTTEQLDAISEEIAREYVTAIRWNGGLPDREQANEYAKPDVGEAFMIATYGVGRDLGDGTSRVVDYASGQHRVLGWPYHFGGVIARCGADRVTLENYARGDNRANRADPRWYFQMYSEDAGTSFHERCEAKREYANPLTVSVRQSDVR
jgi:hypothetical protein